MNKKVKIGLATLGLSVALIGCSTGDVKDQAELKEEQIEQSVEDAEEKVEEIVEDVEDKANEEIADLKGQSVPTSEDDIYAPQLLQVALTHLNITEDDIVLKNVEYKVGKPAEFEFIYDGMEYEYEIDYMNNIEKEKSESSDHILNQPGITFEQALNIALEDSDTTTEELRELSISLDSDHPTEIEVEFETHDGIDTEYKINSTDGEILSTNR